MSGEASPGARGFRMPAEWEPHEATVLAWPRDPRTWVAGLEPARDAFVQMIGALVPGERVELLVEDEPAAEEASGRLNERGIETVEAGDERSTPADVVRLHRMRYVDSWVRDTGPTVLVHEDGRRLAVDWRFDAWGGKYEDLEADDALAQRLAGRLGLPRLRTETVLEGGAIDVDGEGTVLTTSACLLNPNRGTDRTRGRMEQVLAEMLGAEQVIWLGEGIEGDDTDGHVDDVARFVAPGHVVLCRQEDRSDPDHAPLEDNRKRLSEAIDARGRSVEVDPLPMPRPVRWQGQRLPASYANFYIGNQAVLLPVFGDPADTEARTVLERCFPDREIVGIDARGLVVGSGACHCLTQQIPRA